jgi:tetratricopeptide (TPR) repeat protein
MWTGPVPGYADCAVQRAGLASRVSSAGRFTGRSVTIIRRFRLSASSWALFVVTAAAVLFSLTSDAAFGQAPAEHANQSGSAAAQVGATSSAAVGNATKPEETPKSDPALAEAQSLLQAGKVGEAETTTRQFLQGHADSADGHFLLGHILFEDLQAKCLGEEKKESEGFGCNDTAGGSWAKTRDEKARESLAEFSAGTKYGAPSAADLKTVAFDYVLLKDNLTAAKWLTVSLKLEPKDAQGWYYLGRMKYSQDQFPDAIQAFERCLKLEPRNSVAEYNVGLSYEGLQQKDEAIQAYQTAIAWQAQSETKSSKPFTRLARLYVDESQPEKAVPYLQQAVAAFPQVSLVHEELGRAYSALNQLSEAQKELEVAVSLEPNVASVHFILGQVYRKLGMMDKAKLEFQRVEELDGTHSSDKPGN